jgi:hypothetical protein
LLYFPRILLIRALWQLETARKLRDERNAILQNNPQTTDVDTAGHPVCHLTKKVWTLEHGFFAVMGGFVASVNAEDAWILDDGPTITARGIIELAKRDQLPEVDTKTIRARSKTDRLSKTVVIFQATWMFIQTIARRCSGLPVTLLEINTLAHIVCALALYVIWWKKPQDAEEQTEIPMDQLLAAFMSSRNFRKSFRPISQTPETLQRNVDHFLRQARNQAWQGITPPNASGYQILGTVSASFPWHKTDLLWPNERDKLEVENRSVSNGLVMLFPGQWLDGLPFTLISGPRHLTREDIERLKLWAKLFEHSDFEFGDRNHFATDARLTRSAPQNRIQGNLSEFSEQKVLSAFALFGFIYGGMHATSWNSYFPTVVEKMMWRVGATVVMGGGLVVYVLAHLMRRWTLTFLWPLGTGSHAQNRTKSQARIANCVLAVIQIVVAGLSLSRGFLIVEAFISCRSLPLEAYSTVEWATFLPHIT